MEEQIDFFGKYAAQMTKIHDRLFNSIPFNSDFDTEMIERTLLQCNYAEYLEHHPEEPGYHCDIFDFNFGDHCGRIMTMVNKDFYKSKDDYSCIVDALQESWTAVIDCRISFNKTGCSIKDLNFDTYDMMQTAHFLYPKKELIDNKSNYQIFKIIYPYETLEPVLSCWDTSASF